MKLKNNIIYLLKENSGNKYLVMFFENEDSYALCKVNYSGNELKAKIIKMHLLLLLL